jgi:gas vesicle protein
MAENRSGEIISAFLLGGIIGAALGILFAPAPGKKTRAKINEWLEETTEYTKEKIEKLEEEIKKRKDQLVGSSTK